MNVAGVPKRARRTLDERQWHNCAALGSLALELVEQSKTRDLTAFEWDAHFLKLQRFRSRALPREARPIVHKLAAMCGLCSERELRDNRDQFCLDLLFALPKLRAEIQHDMRTLCRHLLFSSRDRADCYDA